MSSPTLAVVAPVFNEAAEIASIVSLWKSALESSGVSNEIVLCDDGSTDTTLEVLRQLTELDGITVVQHEENRGAGAALRTAIRASTADWLILIDSDGQFDSDDGLGMWKEIRGLPSVAAIGVRNKADRLSLVLGSKLTGWLANRIFGTSLRDFNCTMREPGPKTGVRSPGSLNGGRSV